jgi:large subunit ribosomal protein L21
MVYAIIELSGKQLWIETGKFYDVNKLDVSPGETIILNKVLLLKKSNQAIIGNPCINNYNIRAKVLCHFKSKKITVFKMKPKKNMRSKRGFRQNMTRLLIEKI